MPTVITIYDSPDSVNVNDPEATLTVYEMFIGVGPTGATGATGPAGADAVAGTLPNEYVEMTTTRTVISDVLVDITGVTADITLDSTVNIAVFMDCEVSADGECDLGLAISIDGTDHDVVTTHLNGSTDNVKATVLHRTTTPLAAGTYTVKGRFLRSSGTATPQVDRADFLVFGLQGAKGADGINGTDGADSTILIEPTANGDFVVGEVGGDWVKKTLAETKTLLGSLTKKWEATISNPQAVYAQRAQLPIGYTTTAITVTSIIVRLNTATAGAELAADLKFADDIFTASLANATLINALDTTAGALTKTSAFTDATIPAGKFVYIQFDSSPHVDVKDIFLQILNTVDV